MNIKVKYSFTTFAAKHYLVKTTQERDKLLNEEIQFTTLTLQCYDSVKYLFGIYK